MSEFDKIIGYKSIKKELERFCDVLKNYDRYSALGVKLPSGMLIHGEAGLGKTLMANCFIKESGWKCFVCKKDKPDGYFVEEIKRIYDEAKRNQPAIVFLDDFDKFSNSTSGRFNTEEFVTVQTCIDNAKGEKIFTFATANNINCFSDSLLRVGRFDKIIKVDVPNLKDAKAIIEYYLSQKISVDGIDIDEVAKIMGSSSCAVLETVINEAGIYAGANNKDKIDMDDIVSACMRVMFKAPETLSEEKQKYLDRLAYHEAGHTVIAEILEPTSVNLVSVLKYEGDIGGITSLTTDEGYWQNEKLMENRIIVLLGGLAALDCVFGESDIGANSDITRAHRILERFFEEYCIRGFEFFASEFPSNKNVKTKDKKEALMTAELNRYYKIAKKILIENREFLDKIANALMEKKTIRFKEIAEIKKNSILVGCDRR